VFAILGDQTFGGDIFIFLIAIEERANDVRFLVLIRIGVEYWWWCSAIDIFCRRVVAFASMNDIWAQFECV
jgi:hypothetical protein